MATFLCRRVLTGSCRTLGTHLAVSRDIASCIRTGLLVSQMKQKHDSANKTIEVQIDPERLKEIEESPSGWVPPTETPPDLPFFLKRSKMNNLPVYTDYKAGGTRHITVIRKIKGDLKALECLLHDKLDKDLVIQINELTGQVKIKGNHKDKVVSILKELGF
ncbi:39S ribosomal protein L49, mitochondrial-like [Actinia tenebrosa]|uniref:Large ribosomal subunit protein mL49 n=1 Tax=Actinia tenebrosa TaxID=6105 RepID=A0A6P8HYY6_ACTTE|nr:39S ribosomal protein L49, mitochondrial-like [Actinia tenebrosa]